MTTPSKIALIIGASRGLGRNAPLRLARRVNSLRHPSDPEHQEMRRWLT
jgi:NAD(P)-dependent dehydrogenase (short-subunit alcohol dehydrogenase family)